MEGWTLPDDIGGWEDGAVGACEAVSPRCSIVEVSVCDFAGFEAADFDDAGLASSHAASHGLFDAGLHLNVELCCDFADGFHHGFGAAGVDDGFGEVFDGLVLEVIKEAIGDEAFESVGTIVGRDDGGYVVSVEFFGGGKRRSGGIGRRVCGGDGEKVVGHGADEGAACPAGGVERFGEVEHGG